MNLNIHMIEGKLRLVKGHLVELVGELIGNEKLRTDGEATRVRGKIEAAANNSSKIKSS